MYIFKYVEICYIAGVNTGYGMSGLPSNMMTHPSALQQDDDGGNQNYGQVVQKKKDPLNNIEGAEKNNNTAWISVDDDEDDDDILNDEDDGDLLTVPGYAMTPKGNIMVDDHGEFVVDGDDNDAMIGDAAITPGRGASLGNDLNDTVEDEYEMAINDSIDNINNNLIHHNNDKNNENNDEYDDDDDIDIDDDIETHGYMDNNQNDQVIGSDSNDDHGHDTKGYVGHHSSSEDEDEELNTKGYLGHHSDED